MTSRARFPLPDFVEVEIGTYCNRVCSWCPNGWHARGKDTRFMDDRVWRAVVDDLSRHRYRGRFAFHNYNEPLADPHLDDKIADARARMKHATLVLYTNGDFLDAARVRSLEALGVDQVNVTLYPKNDDAFAPPDASAIARFLARIDVQRGVRADKRSKLVHVARVRRMRLVVRVPRIERYGDRAGSVGLVRLTKKSARTEPCLLPQQAAAIDVDGNLKLCCHVYDASADPRGRVTSVRDGFVRAWRSLAMQRVRDRLAASDFAGLPCATCHHTMAQELWDRAASRL